MLKNKFKKERIPLVSPEQCFLQVENLLVVVGGAACDGSVACDGLFYHNCFQCILLCHLKLHSYVYNDILRGTTHAFFPGKGVWIPLSAHEPVQLPS